MLNNEKIKWMTKLAIFEEKEGKEDIRISQYYRTDYVRYHVLKSFVSVTVGYLLILVLILIYKSEYVIREAVKLNYKSIGTYILGIYIMIITLYTFATLIGYSLKYRRSRKKLNQYDKNLKILHKIYQDEEDQDR